MIQRFAFVALLALLYIAAPMQGQESGIRFVNVVSGNMDLNVDLATVPVASELERNCASLLRSEFPTGVALDVAFSDAARPDDPPLLSQGVQIDAGFYHTLCLMGSPGNVQALDLKWNGQNPAGENVLVRVVHAAAAYNRTVEIRFGGNRYFPPLQRYAASGFVTTFRSEVEMISARDGQTGGLLGNYSGEFEPGNSYTLFLVDGEEGVEFHVLRESVIDKQCPMAQLGFIGDRVRMRAIHLSYDASAFDWNFNQTPIFKEITYGSASAMQRVIVQDNVVLSITQPAVGGAEVLNQTLNPDPAMQHTLIAINGLATLHLLQLEWNREMPEQGQARIRAMNLVPGIDKMTVKIRNGENLFEQLQPGAVGEFRDIPAGTFVVQAQRAGAGEPAKEGELSLGTGVYTLFIIDIGGSIEMRLLEEHVDGEQKPLRLLQTVQSGETAFRVANFMTFASDGSTIRVGGDIIAERLAYSSATGRLNSFTPAAYDLQFHEPDNSTSIFLETNVELKKEQYTLLVLLGSEPANTQAIQAVSGLKPVVHRDSVLVRFVHAARGTDRIDIQLDGADNPLVEGLEYGSVSRYAILPRDLRNYEIFDSRGIKFASVVDDADPGRAMTVFIAYTKEGILQAYFLPEEQVDEFNPMEQLATTVLTSVQESRNAAIGLRIAPNPAARTGIVEFHTGRPAHIAATLYGMHGGAVLHMPARLYNAGTQRLELALGNLAAGTYMLRLEIGNAVYTTTVQVQR